MINMINRSLFARPGSSRYQIVLCPDSSHNLDYEGNLAVVCVYLCLGDLIVNVLNISVTNFTTHGLK